MKNLIDQFNKTFVEEVYTRYESVAKVTDSLNIGFAIRTLEGTILLCNEQFKIANSISKDQSIIGTSITEIVDEGHFERVNNELEKNDSHVCSIKFHQIRDKDIVITNGHFTIVDNLSPNIVVALIVKEKFVTSDVNKSIQNIIENIKIIRLENNMTQTNLANLLGTSLRSFQRIEAGEVSPSLEFLLKFINIFQIDLKRMFN